MRSFFVYRYITNVSNCFNLKKLYEGGKGELGDGKGSSFSPLPVVSLMNSGFQRVARVARVSCYTAAMYGVLDVT
jgi:hypothetical protein